MADYDFTACLSPLDFELLSKDLLEADLGIKLENFSEGRDQGIDLRYAPTKGTRTGVFNLATMSTQREPPKLIVQCKRYSVFSDLKSTLKNSELAKIQKLNPNRYILTTSVPLSPQQSEEIKTLLSPFVQSTGDIYGRERLNSLLTKYPEIERRHIKLWVTSAGVLDSIINAGTHLISREEVERTIAASKVYVRNSSFDEALAILKKHHVCIISGLPGIGKTTLARMLLLYFYDRKFDVIKITGDISEARNVGYHSKPRFYYYDDFLGQTAQADKLNKNEDQRLLDFMASVRDSRDSVFVLTTREYILNQARLHYEKLSRENFDHRTCIIDLSKYSRRIRAQILYNHLHFSTLPRAHLEALVTGRGYLKIVDHQNYNPRLVEYLTDSAWMGDIPARDYPALFLRKLDNPVAIWDHAFRNQLSDRARHLLFVLTTMPRESLMRDVEKAFEAFHLPQCRRFGIARSTTDFNTALKELDGTFVATRQIQYCVLVRFQNPSIRDFMQNLLFGGECLRELLGSLVFFEQARWFADTLREESPQLSLLHLRDRVDEIVGAMEELIDMPSCSIRVEGADAWQRFSILQSNPATRVAQFATAVKGANTPKTAAFIASRIGQLAERLEAGSISATSCFEAVETLGALGHLANEQGERFEKALKTAASSHLSDFDDFETVAGVIDALPHLFGEDELEEIKGAYAAFAAGYAEGCVSGSIDISDPELLREEASRIEHVGDLLTVNTQKAQERINEHAEKMERRSREREEWEYDHRSQSGGGGEDCSDREMDSMFGTLGS